ncbi:hypothetical protein D9M68_715730 [compost metagenome]
MVGPPAGAFQPFVAVLLREPQQALDGSQLDQNSIAEQHAYQGGTGRTDALGLAQAPLDIVQLPSLCLGWQMVGDGTAGAGRTLSQVRGNQDVFLIEMHHRRRSLEPQRLAGQPERRRVIGPLELNVAIPVYLHSAPGRQLGRHCR